MIAGAYDPLNGMNKLLFCWCVATSRTPALDVFPVYLIRLYKQPSMGEVLANPKNALLDVPGRTTTKIGLRRGSADPNFGD